MNCAEAQTPYDMINKLQEENKQLRGENEQLRAMLTQTYRRITTPVSAEVSLRPQERSSNLVVIHPQIGQPVLESEAVYYDQFGVKRVWRRAGRLVPVEVEYNSAPTKSMEIYYGSQRSIQSFGRETDQQERQDSQPSQGSQNSFHFGNN